MLLPRCQMSIGSWSHQQLSWTLQWIHNLAGNPSLASVIPFLALPSYVCACCLTSFTYVSWCNGKSIPGMACAAFARRGYCTRLQKQKVTLKIVLREDGTVNTKSLQLCRLLPSSAEEKLSAGVVSSLLLLCSMEEEEPLPVCTGRSQSTCCRQLCKHMQVEKT